MTKAAIISAAWNLVFLAGALMLAYGCWMAWRPLGFIFSGVYLAVLGYGGGFEQARKVGRR